MKKLLLFAITFISLQHAGGAMANRLDDLKADFQSKHDAMKADTENERGYTLRHLMLHMGIRHTLSIADGFDMANVSKKEALIAKKESAAEHLTRVENVKSRELLELIMDKLTAAAEANSVDPILDLAEAELKAFEEDGQEALDAGKIHLWLSADEVEHATDLEDMYIKAQAFTRLVKRMAMS